MTTWWSQAQSSAQQSPQTLAQQHFWNAWGDAARTWWSWWLTAASAPWLRQPWPHAGYWPEEAALPNAESATASARRQARPAGPFAAPEPARPHPKLKTPTNRLERRAKTLKRRKVNPGGA